jgi:hypothetical protein
VIGSGGENCQWIVKLPGAIAQKGIVAMRKSPVHGVFGNVHPFNDPRAIAPHPTGVLMLRNTHGSGPLHHSFCRVVSKVLLSGLTPSVSTQLLPSALAKAMSARLAS